MICKSKTLWWSVCFCLIMATTMLSLLSLAGVGLSDNKMNFSKGLMNLFIAFILVKINFIPNVFLNKFLFFLWLILGIFFISKAIQALLL